MAFDDTTFCWNEIVTGDAEAARAFYAATLGWEAVDHEVNDGDTTVVFVAGDVPRAHLRAPEHEAEPCQWTTYLRVADVDAATTAAQSCGGRVLLEPCDYPPGRMSVVRSPAKAVLSLFHEADEEAVENAPPGPGSRHGTELHSREAAADLAWLVESFGFATEDMPIEGGGVYHMLMAGGQPRGGVTPAFEDAVAGRWLNWIEVPDVDAAIERAEQAGGGRITDPSDWPGVGRMAMLADPTGAPFGVIVPAG